jgi:hypothetical protein
MDSWSQGCEFESCHILEDVSDKASYYVEKKTNKGSLMGHTKKKFYDKKKQKKKHAAYNIKKKLRNKKRTFFSQKNSLKTSFRLVNWNVAGDSCFWSHMACQLFPMYHFSLSNLS